MQQLVSCPNCSNPLNAGQNFCQRCGTARPQPSKEQSIAEAVRYIDSVNKGSFGSKREIKELPKVLWEDELPEQIVTGYYNDRTGLLVATDRRMIFLDKGLLGQLKVEDFWYDNISSMESTRGIVWGSVTVYSSGNKAVIDKVPKKEIDDFVSAQRNKLATRNRSAPTPGGPTSTAATLSSSPSHSPLDDLAKLNELHQNGVLTDEEYAKSKERILRNL